MSKQTAGWRVWYDDGSVHDSRTLRWEDLPEDGLLVKMLYYTDGTRQIQHGMDWYYEAPHPQGVIRGTAMERDLPELPERYPGAILKRGRWAPEELYYRVLEAAMASTWE